MKYIEQLTDGQRVGCVYLCRQKTTALTKNGKEYINVTLQDKTGQIEGKIWDIYSPGIREFEAMDYVYVEAHVNVFNNANQLNIQQIRVAEEGQYDPADYFPVSKMGKDTMYHDLRSMVDSVKTPHFSALLKAFFDDAAFVKRFTEHSAAKSVHHGFIGGLMEHTLSVAKLCDNAAAHYPYLNRDLLITGALLHDIGKIRELSVFPFNDYTDEGQLLGHIMIGADMISRKIDGIENFPPKAKNEILHLILSHHGELEFGSPKKPAIMEAFVLSYMDNMDAKLETMLEAFESKVPINEDGWLGFNKLLDSNIRRTEK